MFRDEHLSSPFSMISKKNKKVLRITKMINELIVNQILLIITMGYVRRMFWRIYMLLVG